MARSGRRQSVLAGHLAVLDAFDALHPFRTLSEISAAAELPPSTTHRLVGELCREGLLERLPDRTYRLGIRLWEYASRTPGAVGLREVARPWTQAAHARIRQHVQLAVRSGTDVLFIERLSARDSVVNATLIGGRIPLHASASGLVLLLDAPDAVVDRLVAGGMRGYTAHSFSTADELRQAVRRVREEGYADLPGHIHEESRGLAVPVRGPDRRVSAALGAVVANDGTSPQPVIETLMVAAAGISRSLAELYASTTDDAAALHGPPPTAGVSQRSWEFIASTM